MLEMGLPAGGRGMGSSPSEWTANDVLAVYSATKYAREVVVSEQRPVLIEAMTLRSVD